MNTIPSFSIDHTKLQKGLYVNMCQVLNGNLITTFDIRIRRPYVEEPMNTGAIHAIEHIGAIFLRNISSIKSDIIYFGPMGCRTGFYLLLSGNLDSEYLLPYLIEMFNYIKNFSGNIPGANKFECGNCFDMDLHSARLIASEFLNLLDAIKEENMNYP